MADSDKTEQGGQGKVGEQAPAARPKIIVDDDWKAQARAEKERLARQVEAPKPAQAKPRAAAAAPTEEGEARELPPASFASLVESLAAQTLAFLGGVEDPETRRRYVDLEMAKHLIDTLAMLEGKTKGNLSADEKRLLDQALYELRMRYVALAQRVTEAL